MAGMELPVHPFTGQQAIAVLASGRIVWPVRGAAGDDGTGDGGQGGDGDGTGDGGQGGDGLGDAGKKALDEERRARREADKARRAAEAEAEELRAQLASHAGSGGEGHADGQPDADQIRRDAEKQATVRANERILRSEIRAAAAGKLADPADALAYLDLSEFEVGDDGSVNDKRIAEAIGDLLERKPYLAAATAGRFQGTGDGGAAGRKPAAGPKQVTETEFKAMSHADRVKARREGRLADYLNS